MRRGRGLIGCIFSIVVLSIPLTSPGKASAQQSSVCNSSAQALLDQSREAKLEGDIPKIIGMYEEAIKADRTCVAAYLAFGEFLVAAERCSDAASVLQTAKAIAPQSKEVRLLLILALYCAQQYQQVIEEANSTRALIGDYLIGFLAYYVGRAYAKLDRIEMAIEWLELGLHDEASRFVGAIESELLDLYPQFLSRRFDPQIALKLGRLLYQHRQYVEAFSTLQDVTQRVPEFAPPYYWLALVHIKFAQEAILRDIRQTHYRDARRALENYLRLAPNGEYTNEARRLLQELPA